MSEGAEAGLSESVRHLIQQAMAADIRLRCMSALRHSLAGELQPVLHASKRIHGRLHFERTTERQSRFLLADRDDDAKIAARIRVGFDLRPIPEPPTSPDAEPSPKRSVFERVLYAPPSFVDNPGDPSELKLRLQGDRALEASFTFDGELSDVRVNGTPLRPGKLDPLTLKALIETLHDWRRDDAAAAASEMSGDPGDDPALGGLVRSTLEDMSTIHSVVEDPLPRSTNTADDLRRQWESLAARAPSLAGRFAFERLYARHLLLVDRRGALIEDRALDESEDLDLLRIDVETKLVDTEAVEIRFHPWGLPQGEREIEPFVELLDDAVGDLWEDFRDEVLRAPSMARGQARSRLARLIGDSVDGGEILFVELHRPDVFAYLVEGEVRGDDVWLLVRRDRRSHRIVAGGRDGHPAYLARGEVDRFVQLHATKILQILWAWHVASARGARA